MGKYYPYLKWFFELRGILRFYVRCIMKFEIRRKPNDINVIQFEIIDSNANGFWKHWKPILITAVASCVITGVTVTGFYYYGVGNIEIQLKNERSTELILRSKDDQKRYGQGADGATSTIHRTPEDAEGKN